MKISRKLVWLSQDLAGDISFLNIWSPDLFWGVITAFVPAVRPIHHFLRQERAEMFSRVGQFHRREGVAPWLSLVTIFGIIALFLSMMTLSAALTHAEEGPEADVLDTSEELVGGLESDVVEDESLSDYIEQLGESLNGLTENVKSSGFNSDIEVEISEIVAVKPGADIELGDKVIVSGSW